MVVMADVVVVLCGGVVIWWRCYVEVVADVEMVADVVGKHILERKHR